MQTAAPIPAPDFASFATLPERTPDPLLRLIAQYRDDPRPEKLDLGVGVFRDDSGATPILASVKAAERVLVATQQTKAYLGTEGDQAFTDNLAQIALGRRLAASDRLTGLQTPGGTGAVRLGAELLAASYPDSTVWISAPTWFNHVGIVDRAGLAHRTYRYYDSSTSTFLFEAMLEDLGAARPGDVVLLHGCCHNPSGATPSSTQWAALAALIADRGLVPFVDLAYQGLGDGLEDDAAPTRALLEAVPEALVAYSCDKNFGLYRERVGALWVQGADANATRLARANALALARANWSMPPDHGAAIVRHILESEALRQQWRGEVDAMRIRTNTLRSALASAHPRLAPLAVQRGMFALLPILPADVIALREQYAVYMAADGRINIAGLTLPRISLLLRGLVPLLDR